MKHNVISPDAAIALQMHLAKHFAARLRSHSDRHISLQSIAIAAISHFLTPSSAARIGRKLASPSPVGPVAGILVELLMSQGFRHLNDVGLRACLGHLRRGFRDGRPAVRG